MTSLQVTEEVYSRVIEQLISQLSNSSDIQIAPDAIDYLKKNWKERLAQTEVYSNTKINQSQENSQQVITIDNGQLRNPYNSMIQFPQTLLRNFQMNQFNLNEHNMLKYNMNIIDSQYSNENNQKLIIENPKINVIQSNEINNIPVEKKNQPVEVPKETKKQTFEIDKNTIKKEEPKQKFQFEFQTKINKNMDEQVPFKEDLKFQAQENIYYSSSEEDSEDDDEKLFKQPMQPKIVKKVKLEEQTQQKSQQNTETQQIQTKQIQYNQDLASLLDVPKKENQSENKDTKSDESEGMFIFSADDDIDDQNIFVTKNHIYGYYEKVNKVKGKWKVILKDLIFQYEDKEYIFHQLNGEWNFETKQ